MPEQHAGAAGQAPECQICPLCAGLAALRGTRSEAVEHLVKGAAEPDGAPAPGRRRARPPHPGDAAGNGLQRIDIG